MKQRVGVLGVILLSLFSLGLKQDAKPLPVPLIRQATPYSCGPAALLSVLFYWQVYDEGEKSLYAPLKTTEAHGTDPIHIAHFAKELGLKVELRENVTLREIRQALDRKEPVIVDFQAWADEPTDYKNNWEDGHYAVVNGMDESRIYFMDPSVPAGYAYLTHQDFLDRWHDYEMRDGVLVKTYQLAIFVRGEKPLFKMPAPLAPIQ